MAIVSGVVLAAAFLGTSAAHPMAFMAFIAVLVGVALVELDGAFRAQGLRPATPVVFGAGAVMLFGGYLAGAAAQSLGLVLLTVGGMAWTLVEAGARRGEEPRRAAAHLGATVLMTMWVPFLVSFFGLLLRREDGMWIAMAVVALSVASDIGAYAFGSRFGRHTLAPSVSPGKTWEGLAGGLATALLLAGVVTAPFVPGLGLGPALVLAAGVTVASTVGDLTESLVKRDLGVKDLGRIVPGHGGIMDRADAIIFSVPTAHVLLLALGM